MLERCREVRRQANGSVVVQLVLDLIENAALILGACFAYRFISARWPEDRIKRQVASGLLFGAAAVMAMSLAVAIPAVGIFDARSVVLSMAALFGGTITGGLAALLAGGYRIYLGGEGVLVGVGVIATSALFGILVRKFSKAELVSWSVGRMTAFGAAVHIGALGWFALLPGDYSSILTGLAGPYFVTLTAASIPMGLLLREVERIRSYDNLLQESEQRYQTFFDTTVVAALEEDLSEIYQEFEDLRAAGVKDLRYELLRSPYLVDQFAKKVHILHTNQAALDLFEVSNTKELRTNIAEFFTAEARETFIDELCAWWRGADHFQQETTFLSRTGNERRCVISFPLPKSFKAARHVPVSILNLTDQRAAEKSATYEKARLNEVIWGTGAGTWEWNIQTGEVRFNERWAEILGHSLADLEPISIKTWLDLAHPDDLERSNRALEKVFKKETDFYQCEARMQHKTGRWIWVLDRGKVVEWNESGEPVRMSGTHMDITEKKEAELHALRLSELRVTLLRCHAAILRSATEKELFRNTTNVLIRDRGYALVWIGVPENDADKTVRPVAWAGDEQEYVQKLKVSWAETESGLGPTGRAVREKRAQVTEDLSQSASFAPWKDEALSHALASSIALPLIVEGRAVAVLNIYSSTKGAFVDEELSLVTEFANNLSLALNALRLRADKRRLHTELADAALGAVRAIAATIEKRDPYTSGHQLNVAKISEAIARKLEWDEFKIEGLRLGAMIHDIGKIYVPAEILNRPGKLDESEFGMIKAHPRVGYEILSETTFPWPIQDMVGQHHERIDGTGYPDGLKGDQICDEAKVIAVADVLDAITSHRPYRPGMGIEKALEELKRGRSTAYEEWAVDACLDLIEKDGYRWTESALENA